MIRKQAIRGLIEHDAGSRYIFVHEKYSSYSFTTESVIIRPNLSSFQISVNDRLEARSLHSIRNR